ncbi:MAG: hypothetical protein PVH65_02920 [Chloroflexota bacterium]|jgi:hypothetical protein
MGVDPVSLNRRWFGPACVLLLLLLVGCAIATPTPTADSGKRNGLPIAPEFQSFYQENGGLRLFGFPISEAYKDADSDRLIQYFQRLRLEYDSVQNEVLVSPLGQWAVTAKPGIAYADLDLLTESPRSDFKVEDAFLAFYQTYGGESLFGPPITEQLDGGGTRSQYFRNGRLDWVPEAQIDQRVQLARLGEAHYRQVGIFDDPGRSRPMDSAGIREADVSATVRAPILYHGEEQTVYVDVKTPENQRPVAGVSIRITAYYNGTSESFSLPETDGTGHVHDSLALNDLRPGQRVRLVVEATSPGGTVIGTTSKSFKSWW